MPNCPACDSVCSRTPVHSFGADEAAQHFVLEQEYPEPHQRLRHKIAELWQADRCDILACRTCGLKFASPFVAGDGEFYNLAYPYSSYPKDRWEFQQTLTALKKLPQRAGNALEIGSGFGYFANMVAPAFVPPNRFIAIEYNDQARRRLEDAGFVAIGADVRSATLDDQRGQLDLIFMFQVLEHMDQLDSLFARLRELARPGCDVFIAVPNHHRIDFNESHASLRDMPPNHLSRWTQRSFQLLAARFRIELVDSKVEPVTLAAFAKQDLVYAHMRRAQLRGSMANRIRSRPRSGARVAMEGAAALACAPLRIPAWFAAASTSVPLGNSMWVHLRFGEA
jgi:SAM-dependent methyltransferase